MRTPTIARLERDGAQRRSYRVERKFDGTRTAAEVVRSLVRAHS
jgi:hypothetical protein